MQPTKFPFPFFDFLDHHPNYWSICSPQNWMTHNQTPIIPSQTQKTLVVSIKKSFKMMADVRTHAWMADKKESLSLKWVQNRGTSWPHFNIEQFTWSGPLWSMSPFRDFLKFTRGSQMRPHWPKLGNLSQEKWTLQKFSILCSVHCSQGLFLLESI